MGSRRFLVALSWFGIAVGVIVVFLASTRLSDRSLGDTGDVFLFLLTLFGATLTFAGGFVSRPRLLWELSMFVGVCMAAAFIPRVVSEFADPLQEFNLTVMTSIFVMLPAVFYILVGLTIRLTERRTIP